MAKQSRLRVQSAKRGRRILLYAVLVVVLSAAGWLLEQNYGLISSVQETFTTLTRSFSPGAPRRGEFYDRNLKQIAVNKERVSVYVRTQEIKSIAETVMELAPILSLDEEALKSHLESGVLRLWVAEDISQDQEIALKAKRLPGVYLHREEKRVYPNKSLAAHLIGYVESGIGLAGVEAYYDRMMASSGFGKEKVRFNAPQDLVLTLDLKIQDVLEGLVEEIKKQHKTNKVLAYVMDSRTGGMIGGAQLPGFDPNVFTQYPREVLENPFVQPMPLPEKFCAFLRDVAILQDQETTAGDSPLPWSVRSGDGALGNQLQLWDWLGLHEKTEADFRPSSQTDEVSPGDRRLLRTSPSSLDMVPEQMTPLKLMTVFSTILGDGKRIRPFVAHKSFDSETGAEVLLVGNSPETSDKSPTASPRFFDVERLLASQARLGEGEALFFGDAVLSAAASDGQKLQVDELLLVKIPAGSSEMILLVVAEHDPAGPRPRNAVLEKSIEELVEDKVERIAILQEVARTVADVVEPELSDDGNYQRQNWNSRRTIVHASKSQAPQVAPLMPDLRGQSLRKSLRLLQGVPVKISIRGTGKVVAQEPAPGTILKQDADCTLILEKGEEITLEKLSKGTLKK